MTINPTLISNCLLVTIKLRTYFELTYINTSTSKLNYISDADKGCFDPFLGLISVIR
jgi:hypothetical protein